MNVWVYFAGKKASAAVTIAFAAQQNIIYRTAHEKNKKQRKYVANVQHLCAGDVILLVYGPRKHGRVRLVGRVAGPAAARRVGDTVIERIQFSDELRRAGYTESPDGGGEVIRLEDVELFDFQLMGTYDRITIQRLLDVDAAAIGHLGVGSSVVEHKPRQTLVAQSASARGDERSPIAAREAPEGTSPPAPPPTTAPRITRTTAFDVYLMIDWSSRNEPVHGTDSIWLAWLDRRNPGTLLQSENIATRHKAIERIRELLSKWRSSGRRVLVGFDFAFGYPAQYADALELPPDGEPWSRIFRHYSTGVRDDEDNHHNRDAFAAQCNEAIGDGPGPFWGCVNNAAIAGRLTTTRVGLFQFPYEGLNEFRATETTLRSTRRDVITQSVWKLNQGVSVGGQTILGIHHLAKLRWEGPPELQQAIRVWPFETGFSLADDRQIVVAEIFPSVLAIRPHYRHTYRDLGQVATCVEHTADLDDAGQLVDCFGAPRDIPEDELANIQREEGWILFV